MTLKKPEEALPVFCEVWQVPVTMFLKGYPLFASAFECEAGTC